MAGGQTGAVAADSGQSLGRAWQPYRGVFDLPGRLSRSTTIALIASPIGLLVVSVIRLLIVADYNPATASAIVSSGGYVDDGTRTIHYYRSAQIASQQICQLTGPPARQPLIPLFPAHLSAPTTTPACAAPVAGRAVR
jgi:hypothetical protein